MFCLIELLFVVIWCHLDERMSNIILLSLAVCLSDAAPSSQLWHDAMLPFSSLRPHKGIPLVTGDLNRYGYEDLLFVSGPFSIKWVPNIFGEIGEYGQFEVEYFPRFDGDPIGIMNSTGDEIIFPDEVRLCILQLSNAR